MFISLIVLLSLVILTIGCVVLVKNREPEQQTEQPDSTEYLVALEQQQQDRKRSPYPAPYHIEQIVSEHLEATKGKN